MDVAPIAGVVSIARCRERHACDEEEQGWRVLGHQMPRGLRAEVEDEAEFVPVHLVAMCISETTHHAGTHRGKQGGDDLDKSC